MLPINLHFKWLLILPADKIVAHLLSKMFTTAHVIVKGTLGNFNIIPPPTFF